MIFVLYLIAMAVLLVFSAFFSASETALFSLSRQELREFEEEPSVVHRAVVWLRSDPQELLATVLFGNMAVNTLYCSMGTMASLEAAEEAGPTAGVLLGVGSLLALILGGEVGPKAAAVGSPVRISHLAAIPLSLFHRLLMAAYIPRALAAVSDVLARPFRRGELPQHVTWEELQELVVGATGGRDEFEDAGVAHEIVERPETTVRDVMIPRAEVTAVSIDADRQEIAQAVRSRRTETLPVFDESPDRIVGLVRVRDVLLGESGLVRDHVLPVRLLIAETARLESVLDRFRELKCHMAIVVNDQGVWTGVLTAQEIAEEIVLLLRLGRTPRAGDTLRLGHIVLTIDKVSDSRVEGLHVERADNDATGGAP